TAIGDGARYDPQARKWSIMSNANAPAPRYNPTLLWTGSELIVWGGEDASRILWDGARYSPSTDAWTSIRKEGAPSPRSDYVAVWTGEEMIIWGGFFCSSMQSCQERDDGRIYNPTSDSWRSMSSGILGGRHGAAAVWSGREILIWGGAGR